MSARQPRGDSTSLRHGTALDPKKSRLPALGRRGEGWVIGQVLLVTAVLLSPLASRGRHDYAAVAYVAGGTLLILGLLFLAAGGLRLGHALTPLPVPRTETFTTKGPYGLVRHPMYGGGILIALGWTILFASVLGLVCSLVLIGFLELKARREELWLRERFDDYEAYRQRTPHKFLPFLY